MRDRPLEACLRERGFKPIFPLAATPYEVLAARFLDRLGKGVRDAPRDALVADVTPEKLRGAGFGLRQSLDTVGAFVGPVAAMGLMAALNGNMRAVFALAIIPAVIAMVVLVLGVVLRGANAGIPLALLPLVYIVMNVVYAIVSAPVGSLSDNLGRKALLASGIAILIIADLTLALMGNIAGVLIGVALWGLHMGLTEGLLTALVADTAPVRLRRDGVRTVQPHYGRDNACSQRAGRRHLVGSGGAAYVSDRWGALV